MNKRTGVILFMIAVFMMAGHSPAATADDHGNDCAGATLIAVDTSIGGRIDAKSLKGTGKQEESDVDYFRFHLPSSGVLSAYTTYTEEATDTFGYLINEAGMIFAQDDDGGRVYNFQMVQSVPRGEYCVAVRHYESDSYPYYKSFGTGSGSYTLNVEFEPTGVSVVALNDDNYAALAVHENGEKIAPIVERSLNGVAVRMRGAVWLSPSGDSFVVLNGSNGLPVQAALQTGKGEYGFVFSNYTATTVDVAMITPGRSRSVYITRNIPVDAGQLLRLNAMAARTASGGSFSLTETIKDTSPILRLSSCAAVTASEGALKAELPCESLLIEALDLYLPQYENTVLSDPLFLNLAQCGPSDFDSCRNQWVAVLDEELGVWIGFWKEIVSEDWPVFDVLLDNGFYLTYGFDTPLPPPGINQEVLEGYHTFEYCQGVYNGDSCIKVKIFYDPYSNINVITADFPLDKLADTFLSETYTYRNKKECRSTMRQYVSGFEALLTAQGWKVKKRPDIDCGAFGN